MIHCLMETQGNMHALPNLSAGARLELGILKLPYEPPVSSSKSRNNSNGILLELVFIKDMIFLNVILISLKKLRMMHRHLAVINFTIQSSKTLYFILLLGDLTLIQCT